jgi:hypothetical protein
MTIAHVVDRDERVQRVRSATAVNGIAFIEVTSTDQRELTVHFLKPLPGQTGGVPAAPVLTTGHLRIDGGVRITHVRVTAVTATDERLRMAVDRAGDFSTYTLRVVTSPTDDAPPPGFDPLLSSIDFSFKVACPTPFDCEAPAARVEFAAAQPNDCLAKDYHGFVGLMLDRLAQVTPRWRERNAADQQVMLVELLAYVADQLSYYQDAVATEAYLGTARLRTSLRRHARLLDYRVHDGCNARTWLHVSVAAGGPYDGFALPAGTRVYAASGPDLLLTPLLTEREENDLRARGATVFETKHDRTLRAAHNAIDFHTWSNAATVLPIGATTATVRAPAPLDLRVGDALLLEELRDPAATGFDPTLRRWVVRLTALAPVVDPLDSTPLVQVHWHTQDALPFALCLIAEEPTAGGTAQVVRARARGNLILADHGMTRDDSALEPPLVGTDDGKRFRPRLRHRDITFAQPYDHAGAAVAPAASALRQDPRAALAQVSLSDGTQTWECRSDLLGSDRFAAEFCVETEDDGAARLRFGDDIGGKRPAEGTLFAARYRVGSGPAGNVGAGALRRLGKVAGGAPGGVIAVFNPAPAAGGTAPESHEEVRRYAPYAFRLQERAVTEEDYAAAAQRHPEVQRARAEFRWTGSWITAVVTVDRRGGGAVNADAQFRAELLALLERLRMAGVDLELRDPLFVPLDIAFQVCLKPGYFAADVKERLLDVFSSGATREGGRGFFHPDNFSFGRALWLSELYEQVMAVEGIETAQPLRFQRWGKTAAGELAAGVLRPAASEILRCDTDPNFPERGAIDFEVLGER